MFRSQAQRKFLFSQKPRLAAEFASKTPKGTKLPEHVGDKKRKTKKKSISQMYQDATKGLQNYGRNISKNVSQGQNDRSTKRGTSNNYGAINPFPNPFKSSSYKKTHKKTKAKISVDNKMKGSYGETDIQKGKKPVIRINVKKHKGNKSELADTIKHEMYHAKHPKATEKTTYKAMPKKISEAEQNRLIAKLRTKKSNYKVGAIKRKLGISRHEKTQPGDFIKRMNDMKITKKSKTVGRTNKVSIMGLV